MDTGAQKSVVCLREEKPYCKRTACKIKKHHIGVRYRFGDGKRNGIRSSHIRIPIPGGRSISHSVEVVDADILLLIGLELMKTEKFNLTPLRTFLKTNMKDGASQ